MNEQKIEELKNALREIMRLVVQRGKPLSEELKKQLAQVLEHAATRIMQLRAEGVAPAAPAPQVPSAPYPSSNIFGFQYDPKNQNLLVKFMGKDVANAGPVYKYSEIPPFIFDVLRRGAVAPKTSGANRWHRWERGRVPSHGAAMWALVREGNFPFQKVA